MRGACGFCAIEILCGGGAVEESRCWATPRIPCFPNWPKGPLCQSKTPSFSPTNWRPPTITVARSQRTNKNVSARTSPRPIDLTPIRRILPRCRSRSRDSECIHVQAERGAGSRGPRLDLRRLLVRLVVYSVQSLVRTLSTPFMNI